MIEKSVRSEEEREEEEESSKTYREEDARELYLFITATKPEYSVYSSPLQLTSILSISLSFKSVKVLSVLSFRDFFMLNLLANYFIQNKIIYKNIIIIIVF